MLDLTMPHMSGRQTLEELLIQKAELSVLIMSGYAESEALRICGTREHLGFIQKPFSLTKLLDKVQTAFSPAKT